MTYTVHPRTAPKTSEHAWHVITGVIAVLGVLAAGIGAFIGYGANDGTLTLFSWTWNVADLSDVLASFLMIGGGVAAAYSMGVEAARDRVTSNPIWLVALESIVMLAGVGAIVAGIVLLF